MKNTVVENISQFVQENHLVLNTAMNLLIFQADSGTSITGQRKLTVQLVLF